MTITSTEEVTGCFPMEPGDKGAGELTVIYETPVSLFIKKTGAPQPHTANHG